MLFAPVGRNISEPIDREIDFSQFENVTRKSFGDDSTSVALIKGDNLGVLTSLAPSLEGKVKCAYIDPPYNNREVYTHYRDSMPRAQWLNEIKPRIKILWSILSKDGSLWLSIDDRELHYLKVELDSICGPNSFVATVVWEHRISRENRRAFSYNHEYILVYAKDPSIFRKTRGQLPLTASLLRRYRNPDGDPRGAWQSVSLNVQAGHGTASQFYDFEAPNGIKYAPPSGRCWAVTEQRMRSELEKNNIYFGRSGRGVPRLKQFMPDDRRGLTPETIWRADDVGTTSQAKKHLLSLLPRRKPFDTPKPEALIARILHIATNPGDLVLDAYLGSGTTAAVAMKMNRQCIGIESSHQAAEFALARLKLVSSGESGGVSKATEWQGGGRVEYFRSRA